MSQIKYALMHEKARCLLQQCTANGISIRRIAIKANIDYNTVFAFYQKRAKDMHSERMQNLIYTMEQMLEGIE